MKLFGKKTLEMIPPTADALYQHIKRAHFQSAVWRQAHVPIPNLPDVLSCGWEKRDDGKLTPTLMTVTATPQGHSALTKCSCKGPNKCSRKACGCVKIFERCTFVCACAGSCLNVYSTPEEHESDSD